MKLIDAIREMLGGGQPEKPNAWIGEMFHRPTQQKHGGKRHRPYTKAPLSGESKKRRKMAAKSRRINRRLR